MMLPQNPQSAILPMQSEVTNIADATLVDRVRAGDPAAFELIMRRNNQRRDSAQMLRPSGYLGFSRPTQSRTETPERRTKC